MDKLLKQFENINEFIRANQKQIDELESDKRKTDFNTDLHHLCDRHWRKNNITRKELVDVLLMQAQQIMEADAKEEEEK